MFYEVGKLKHKQNSRKPQSKLIYAQYCLLSGCKVFINCSVKFPFISLSVWNLLVKPIFFRVRKFKFKLKFN